MQPFDCLAKECPLFGPHLLEASAGTGKTFAIEHVYVRFILEGVEVEEILVVTFTRAATRELKARIRLNLEKTLHSLQSGVAIWPYLEPHLGSDPMILRLTDALAAFDQCQIFTIHGFCYRMLKEFAFEAKVSALPDPDKGQTPEKLKVAVYDFLENGIPETVLCKEQLALLFKEFDSVEEIAEKLLKLEEVRKSVPFSELLDQCKTALQALQKQFGALNESKLREDFLALQPGFTVKIKGDFEAQLKALATLPDSLGALLKERGSLFRFLAPENRKIKAKEPKLHYPGFFDAARELFTPIVEEDPMVCLQAAWNKIAEKIIREEEVFTPDEILAKMKKSTANSAFNACVQTRYKAAIIDEFQDTDAVQWEIFQALFLKGEMRGVYLVGDPKQSIYRFRKADVYTYYAARDLLGESSQYVLDTNFRSSKSLIGALNALFSRSKFDLPKTKRTVPYHPVRAGAKVESHFGDDKGALHFIVGVGEPNALFDELFLPAVAREIETLGLKRSALLVKDRFQAERALEFLKRRGIPAVARSHMPLGKTASFRALKELFEAVLSPRDQSLVKIACAGPFVKPDTFLYDLKVLLEEKGLVDFASVVLEGGADSDTLQIFEHLFAWEREEGFSIAGLRRRLRYLQELKVEEGGGKRVEVNEEAVQIMTLHISKGLEFDVVFALGLITRTPEGEEVEELDAEKVRQLYVAMTRAKKRLYVPLAVSEKEPAIGTHSPMELFARFFDGSFLEELTQIAKTESVTIERLAAAPILPPPVLAKAVTVKPCPAKRAFTTMLLSSFTTLAKPKEQEIKWVKPDPGVFNLQTMPRGAETGVILHAIFEELFSTPRLGDIDQVVGKQLQYGPLAPWQEPIRQMVHNVVSMPLNANGEIFCLKDVDLFQPEMEFLFSNPPDYVSGFIDLVFYYKGKLYFIDWKSNWLSRYEAESLQKAMEAHDYGLQAALYTESLKRYGKKFPFGGAFYIFVRGESYSFYNMGTF